MRMSFLFIALAGCATTGLPPPSATYTTIKRPADVLACLQQRSGPHSLVRAGNRASIKSRDANPGLAIHIFDNGVVHVQRPSPLGDEVRALMESCI